MPTDDRPLEIRLYDPARHVRADFDCGHARLNNFLKLSAKKQQKRDFTRVYVLTYQGEDRILGYSALNAGRIDADQLPVRARGLPSHGAIPVLMLGQVAVNKTDGGQGLGGILMHHAFEKTVAVAEQVGCHALILDVVSDDGEDAFQRRKDWYAGFGFVEFPSNPARMFMPLAQVRRVVGG